MNYRTEDLDHIKKTIELAVGLGLVKSVSLHEQGYPIIWAQEKSMHLERFCQIFFEKSEVRIR